MQIQQYLEHHKLAKNPFSEEDAQTDAVFKNHCIGDTHHPAWDKVYGDPGEPATAIVFGEKGAGKTAVRLQIARELDQHNRQHSTERVLVVHYDDFNPFLDRFRDRAGRRNTKTEKVLSQWKLWDHMDAILSLGVTGLVDAISETQPANEQVPCEVKAADVDKLERHQARDILLLAACYDQSLTGTFRDRWHELRTRLRFSIWRSYLPVILGWSVSVLVAMVLIYASIKGIWSSELTTFQRFLRGTMIIGTLGVLLAAWSPSLLRFWRCWRLARGVVRHMRVGFHDTAPLRRLLSCFTQTELSGQPLPTKERTDDRYELLGKFQLVLKSLGYTGVVVLVDRLDEPHLINGSAERMKLLLWPMLDNKFLKQAGLGIKLMLPSELVSFVDRESKDFYERSRLDKQNMIRSFHWTGEALYDVAGARMRACATDGSKPTLSDWFDDDVSDLRLMEAMRTLRTPRHLFKFLYRLLIAHCNAHLDHEPHYKISSNTFEPTLALYQREQEAFERGLGAV
ncbi:MAG: hypothetical protein QGG71_11875 [Pirellulaceae bacterium]|jgi:hypothetical protein|nr:hypothetical protein [Pirellulaceae bacterium]